MILSFSLLFLLLFILFKYYEYGVILIAALYIWLDLFSVASSNILTYVSVAALGLFFIKEKNKAVLFRVPAKISLSLIGLSYLATGIFAETPNIIPAILNTIREVLMVLLVSSILKQNKAVFARFYIKVSIVFATAFIFLTLIEMLTSANKYIDFVTNLNAYRVDTYIDELRYGFKRCQSLFSMHTTLGGAAIVTCFPIAWYYFINKSGNLLKVLFWIACAFFCCYASGARSTMVGCAIVSLAFVKRSYLSPKYLIVLLFIFFLIYVNLSTEINEVYDSLVNSDTVGGSDTDMRMEQLSISLKYLNRNFILGNGIYAWTEVAQRTNLYGAESIWFGLMIDRGIIGVIALVVFNIDLLMYVLKKHILRLLFFIVGFLVLSSMSSLPNIIYTYITVPVLVMCTIYDNAVKHNK